MDSIRWFKARKFHRLPLILLNNCLLTFLYISFKSSWDQYIYCVACSALLAVGFASEQRSSQAGRVVLFFFFCSIFTRHGSSCYSVLKGPCSWAWGQPHRWLILSKDYFRDAQYWIFVDFWNADSFQLSLTECWLKRRLSCAENIVTLCLFSCEAHCRTQTCVIQSVHIHSELRKWLGSQSTSRMHKWRVILLACDIGSIVHFELVPIFHDLSVSRHTEEDSGHWKLSSALFLFVQLWLLISQFCLCSSEFKLFSQRILIFFSQFKFFS